MKKLFAGLVVWNARIGAGDLKAVFETWLRTPVRRIGWRIVRTIVNVRCEALS